MFSSRRRISTRSPLVGLLSGILLVAGFSSCRGKATPGPTRATDTAKAGKPSGGKGIAALEAVVVRSAPVQAVVRVPGTLAAGRKVELKTEASGRVVQVAFREGSQVQAGALLVRLFDDDLQATVAKAQAKAKLARLSVERKRQQFAAQGISRQDVDAAEADLAGAEADLALAQAQLRKTRVLAPFAGAVGLRSVEEGQNVSGGQLVTVISQREPWRIEFSIPEEMAAAARVGQELSFCSGGDSLPARIVALDPVLDETTRTRRAVAESRAKSASLFPGQVVDVALPVARAEGLSIPTEALAFDAKGPLAWVYKGGKSVQARLTTGIRTAEMVEARSGLTPGDTVLVVGAANLKAGGEVRIARIRGQR